MAPSETFSGFTGKTLYTPVPNPIFGHILEQIEDLAELKVTLRGLWLFHRKKGELRVVTLNEFLTDRSLIKGLQPKDDRSPEDAIRHGLRLAVTRKTFLTRELENKGTVFLLNTDSDRRTLSRLSTGRTPTVIDRELELDTPTLKKRNIFALYEDSIGLLSPLLADELKEAEDRYPEPWIKEAFGIAAAENKRSWRYVSGILRRWTAEGRETRGDSRPVESGREKDGKPGRHTEKDHGQKYLDEYQRRRGAPPGQRTDR